MSRQKILFFLVTGAVVLLVAGFFARAVIRKKQRVTPPSIEKIQAEEGIPVRTVAPSREDLEEVLPADGTIEAVNRAAVAPQLDLMIMKITADEGEMVREGEPLVFLDKVAIESALQATKTASEEAQRNYDRAQALFRGGAISRQELDRAAVERDASRARYDQDREYLGYTQINSPLTGMVSRRCQEPGEIGAKGQTILEVVALDPVEVKCQISETLIREVRTGQPAKIRLDAYPGREWEAAVTTVAPTAREISRLFTVTIRLANPGHLLKPGMYARVELVRDVHRDALVLPQEAVAEDAKGKPGVFEICDTDTVYFRPVTTGISQKGLTEILSGLDPSCRVAVGGQGRLTDGARVKVINNQ